MANNSLLVCNGLWSTKLSMFDDQYKYYNLGASKMESYLIFDDIFSKGIGFAVRQRVKK